MAHTRVALALLATFSVVPGLAQVDLSLGLVAHYPFSGDAADSSGNGNNGTVYGAVLTSDHAGVPDAAYYFDGASAYIEVPNAPSLNPTVYTIASMVKPMGYYSGTCQGNVIVWKGRDIEQGHYGLMFSDQAYDNSCAIFDSLHQNFYNSHGFVLYDADTPFIQTNQWYCALSTFDGDSIRMYVDGQLRYKRDAAPFGVNTSGLSIGSNSFTSNYRYWLHGVIDDIRIYDRVLNADEIEALCGPMTTQVDDVVQQAAGMVLSPNPMGESAQLTFEEPIGAEEKVDLVALDGRVVRSISGRGTRTITLRKGVDVESGVYVVRLVGNNGFTQSLRIIVE